MFSVQKSLNLFFGLHRLWIGVTVRIFKIDDHMAIGISGLTADARVLADYMRNECLNHSYWFAVKELKVSHGQMGI